MTENLTIVEAAAYIGCSPASLRAWKAQSRGPRYFRAGRLVRYRREDLDEWIVGRLSTPPADEPAPRETPSREDAPCESTSPPPPGEVSLPTLKADSRVTLLRRRRGQEQ